MVITQGKEYEIRIVQNDQYFMFVALTFEKCIIDGGVVVIGQFKTSIETQHHTNTHKPRKR